MNRFRFVAIVVLLAGLVLAACQSVSTPGGQSAVAPQAVGATESTAPEQALTKVKVQLAWVKQGEFTCVFSAIDQGFYAQEGLEVEVLAGGPDVRTVQVVASGAAEFGIGSPALVIASRANGVPIKGIAQTFQDSFTVYIAKKARGFNTIEDIAGAKFGVWFGGGEYEPQLMAVKAGVGKDNVSWLPQKFSMVEFYEDKLDVASATLHNELHVVLDDGYARDDLTIYRASDYGAGMVSDGLYTTEDMINNRPEIVQAFVNATLRGCKWGYEHGNEAAEIVLKFNPELDLQKQIYQVEEVNKLMTARSAQEHGFGYMAPEDWEISQEGLLELAAISEPIDLTAAYDSSFWEMVPEEYKTLSDLDVAAIQQRIAENLGE